MWDPIWEWALKQVREVSQAPAAIAVILVVGVLGGWWGASQFHAERMEVLKLQVDALQHNLSIPPTARETTSWPSSVLFSFIAVLAAVATGAIASAIRNQRLVQLLDAQAELIVFTHVMAGANEQLTSNITEVFERIGWRPKAGETNLPQHAVGIRILGGTFEQRENAWLCLKAIDVEANLVDEDQPPPSLQIVVGAPDPNVERRRNEGALAYSAVVAQRDVNQRLLMDAQNALLETQQTLETVRGGLGKAQEALKAQKREFAHYILRRYSSLKFNNGQQPVVVTIRYVGHGSDFAIVETLERILSEFCNWEPTRDGKNDPALPRADKFKVVFESAAIQSFDDLSFAFSEGDLLGGVSVGKATADRNDYHHLVIKVLPS